VPPLNLYARVRLLAQSCTRDRGCSVRPAFPAPSFLEGRDIKHLPDAERVAETLVCALRLTQAVDLATPSNQNRF
jgi:hypothetical protein